MLLNYGYDVDPICPQCHSSMDTIFHRCFSCPNISTRAELALGKDLFDRIIAAGDVSFAANRCLYPCVTLEAAPSPSTRCEFINFAHGDSFDYRDGPVYGDGSCLNGSYKDLARAGFAVAQVNSEGQVIKAIYGCVPGRLPQSALSAEYAAYFAFATHAPYGTYIGDCQEVLARHNGLLSEALAADNLHACSWKALMLREGYGFKNDICDVIKVKAHQAIGSIEDPHDKMLAIGNDVADGLAKQGALLHPSNGSDVAALKALYRDIKNQALHMIDCLKDVSWTRSLAFGRLPKLPKGTRVPNVGCRTNGKRKHSFKWMGKLWICEGCLLRTASLAEGHNVPVFCSGPPAFGGLLASGNSKGHTLWSAGVMGGGVILFCSQCFHYAAPHPRLLLSPCLGRPCSDASSEMFYLKRRRHPTSRSRLLLPIRVG